MTYIQTESGQLHYFKHEGGNKILLAFHGFGQDHKIFHEWFEVLKKEYSIYAFDLFYHGNSTRHYQQLSKAEWKDYLKQFLYAEKIEKFSVLGYSLGGRFAITSSLSFPDKTENLILVAPDGVYLTIWFKLATNPLLKWLFKYVMLNPSRLDRLMAINDKYKIVSPYLGDFVRKELGDAHNRKRVYIAWNHFKTIGYTKRRLYQEFRKHTFERHIILGKNDHIIKPVKILPLISKMGEFKIDMLPLKHHQLVKAEVAKLIIQKNRK